MKKVLEYIKARFRKHDYEPFRNSPLYGVWYRCSKCGNEAYVPFDFVYSIDMRKARGCKGHE